MDYLVIIEPATDDYDWGAYVPDLPGCVAVGSSRDEVVKLITQGIAFHIEGLRIDGDPVPQPTSTAATVHVETVAA